MKIIEGFCCLTDVKANHPMQVLFGKNTRRGQGLYSSLQINRLVPFKTESEAKMAKKQLQQRKDMLSIIIVQIKITIAEQWSEIEKLPAKQNYIVVWEMNEEKITELLGRYVEGKPGRYPIPGADLRYNGYSFIKDVDSADYIRSEVNRQGGGVGYIGTMEMQIVK